MTFLYSLIFPEVKAFLLWHNTVLWSVVKFPNFTRFLNYLSSCCCFLDPWTTCHGHHLNWTIAQFISVIYDLQQFLKRGQLFNPIVRFSVSSYVGRGRAFMVVYTGLSFTSITASVLCHSAAVIKLSDQNQLRGGKGLFDQDNLPQGWCCPQWAELSYIN